MNFPKIHPPIAHCPLPIAALSQTGALFGLDARIALAVFSLISVVAGAAMVLNMNTTNAKSLAAELTDTGRAIEAFHMDMKTDIFRTLSSPSDNNAFQALYDNTVLKDELQGRWNGPYIRFTSNRHPKFGAMLLQKRADTHTEACSEDSPCHLYLVYNNLRGGIVVELNEILDGARELSPAVNGRVQWSKGEQGADILYYRIGRALSAASE